MKTAIRTFLHDVVADVLGLPLDSVVWANENGPKQANPLVTLFAYSFTKQAMPDQLKANGATVYNTPIDAVLEVQYFGTPPDGGYPTDALEMLCLTLDTPAITDRSIAAGVAFFNYGTIQDVTALLKNYQQYEPRAAVDINFRYAATIGDFTETEETIEGVNVDGKLIYGNLAPDGTISDLTRALDVKFNQIRGV